MENSSDIWQTQVNGQIYEANFEELTQWIAEGSLLPQDKVRRGNLRWIEAQKVPLLHGFFNARELGVAPPPVVATTTIQPLQGGAPPPQAFTVNSPQQFAEQQQTFNEPPPQIYQELAKIPSGNFCVIHAETKADYVCETCTSYLCETCPTENICPMCGATCKKLEAPLPLPTAAAVPTVPEPVSVNDIDDDVKKGANWFYWIAGLSVINSLIMLTGSNMAFIMGLGITQVFDGIADAIAQESGTKGFTPIHGAVFAIDIIFAIFFVMLGYFAGKARKWAFMIGLIIYSLDGVIYLLAGQFLGIAIHGLAVFYLVKGMSAIKK